MEEFRNPDIYATVLIAAIAVIVSGVLTFCAALVTEHEEGYANTVLMFSTYVMLTMGHSNTFSDHKLYFATVSLWLFYRNLPFEYDVWPVEKWQTLRHQSEMVLVGISLLFSCLLCFDVENRLRSVALLILLTLISALQTNPGNEDEEWEQTLNLVIFMFLYLTSFFVRRLANHSTEFVVLQSLWALQTNRFSLLAGGVIVQLCIYVYILFSQQKLHSN